MVEPLGIHELWVSGPVAPRDGKLLIGQMAIRGDLGAVKALLRDRECQNSWLVEALCNAAFAGCVPIVDHLLAVIEERMGPVEATAKALDSAVHAAAIAGHEPIVNHLLERAGVLSAEAQAKALDSAVHGAAIAGHGPIVNHLLERASVLSAEVKAKALFVAVYAAAFGGQKHIIEHLLDVEAVSVEAKCQALFAAVHANKADVVKVLADLSEIPHTRKHNCLRWAIEFGHQESAKLLKNYIEPLEQW